MKKLSRLAIIGTLGMSAAVYAARSSLVSSLDTGSLQDSVVAENVLTNGFGSYDSVLFTDWLAGDVLCVNHLPVLSQGEGTTAETMRSYADLHEARQDSEVLQDELKRTVRHLEAKAATINRLVDREIHLVDAATSWRELDRSYGHNKIDLINRHYPGDTETERYCNRILWELELEAKRKPHRFGDTLARARREMRALQSVSSCSSAD
jgi:hypothetical protein